MEWDSAAKQARSLVFRDGKRIALEQQPRPRVLCIKGRNVVSGMDDSLAKVTLTDGTVKTYGYGTDDRQRPTLKLGDKLLVWDPTTKLIITDGEWTYDIKSDKDPLAYAAIGRKNAQGQTEFWHRDKANGQEVVLGTNGVRQVTSWFVSGPANGKVRKVENVRGGKSEVVRQLTYDEQGRLIRAIGPQGALETFTYDKDGRRHSSKEPTIEQVADKERMLIDKLAKAGTPYARETALYNLGLFYANDGLKPSKARDIAPQIANSLRKFNVILHSYDHDRALSPKEKIRFYEQLLREYPEQKKLLNELINIRRGEL